jgi:preprotein translocase subunit SecD
MTSSQRNALILTGVSGVAGYLFYQADSFWGLVSSALIAVWALVYAIPLMDALWRFKVGFAAALFCGVLVALWPTVEQMSGGKVGCPKYVKDRITFGIVKGLDLQGGLRLVYTVEVEDAIRDKRNNFADEMRLELATAFGFHQGTGVIKRDEQEKLKEKVVVSTPENNVIRLKFKDAADMSKIDERFQKKFLAELTQSRGPAADEVTFKIRSDTESQIRERAVGQAKDTVNKRVDELGLREAAVTVRDEDIIVEVPGKDDKAFEEIKEIIRRTARLEFKMVDDEGSVAFFSKIQGDEDEFNKREETKGIEPMKENVSAGPGRSVEAQFVRIKRDTSTKLRDRDKEGNLTGKPREETQQECLKRLKEWTKTLQVPDDHQIGYEEIVNFDPDTGKSTDWGWRTFFLYARAELTGDYITDAQVAQEQNQGMGRFYVSVTFSPTGADRFEEVTGANVKRRFAIILDDVIDSAPVIQTKISGGHAQITLGVGDPEQQLKNARKLELVLRSGALPAQISPSNESRIGPTLGQDSINQAVKGMLVGSGLVLLFMVVYYRKSGVVADVAVLFNLLIQMAVLASFSATMTLPGIAGLALTIGMAVDANVLINERIREELRAGRSVRAAVEAGYERAFSSIMDGHVTVFISGLILAQYGSGPVKGFAVTLIVGIIASIYTGVFFTRLVFDWWARGAKVKTLSVGAEF